jgi:hypothetical protein
MRVRIDPAPQCTSKAALPSPVDDKKLLAKITLIKHESVLLILSVSNHSANLCCLRLRVLLEELMVLKAPRNERDVFLPFCTTCSRNSAPSFGGGGSGVGGGGSNEAKATQ